MPAETPASTAPETTASPEARQSPLASFGAFVGANKNRNRLPLALACQRWPLDPPAAPPELPALHMLDFPNALWRMARATRVEINGAYRLMRHPHPTFIQQAYLAWAKAVTDHMARYPDTADSFQLASKPPSTLHEALSVPNPSWVRITWMHKNPDV